jgi:hypothetical protein
MLFVFYIKLNNHTLLLYDNKYYHRQMTDAFTVKNYSILTSLNERTIYMKIIDTIGFMCYEGNVDQKELRVSIALNDAYTIITNCFAEENGYVNNISVNSGNMKLKFNAVVGGFLKLEFDVFLKEKIMSNDGQLTMNFNRIEQKQDLVIQSLTKRCEELEVLMKKQHEQTNIEIQRLMDIINKMDVFVAPSHRWTNYSQKQWIANIASTILELSNTDDAHFVPRNINTFYQLSKLIFRSWTAHVNLQEISNQTVSNMEIYCCGHGALTSLIGIENFPNLEILTIVNAPGLTNIVKILSENKHKVKTLKFQTCAGINVVELQTYCQVNGIFLALS